MAYFERFVSRRFLHLREMREFLGGLMRAFLRWSPALLSVLMAAPLIGAALFSRGSLGPAPRAAAFVVGGLFLFLGYLYYRFVLSRLRRAARLVPRDQNALISAITLVTLAGVTVGVAALIIVNSVVEGIDRDIFSKIVEVYPHVKVTDSAGKRLADPGAIIDLVRARPEVAIAEPVIGKQVLLSSGPERDARSVPAQIVGVDRLGPGQLYDIPGQDGQTIILKGREVILSVPLANQLGRGYGQRVLATTGIFARTPNGRFPRRRKLDVIGVFRTGLWEFDSTKAFVSTETAREVFGMAQGADYLHVKLHRPMRVGSFKDSLAAELGADYRVVTWEEENGEFFQALKLEKLGLFVILLLVVIVASFNIIGTLILTVIEKTQEIGVLKAMGCSDGMIRRTFMNSGLTIGLFGTATGLALGLAGCFVLKYVIRLDIPPTVLAFDRIPVAVEPLSVALIAACSIGIAFVAALFPAAQAARLNPVEALRHD